MKSKLLAALLCAAILGSATAQAPAKAAEANPRLIIDGQPIEASQGAILRDGGMLVPMRTIFEALGATVDYDRDTQTIDGRVGDTHVVLHIGFPDAELNGQSVVLQSPPAIVQETTYVPLRFISESLGAEVMWDADSRTASVWSNTVGLTVKEELPARNDAGKPIILQHAGDWKLKWSMVSPSIYQQTDGAMGPEGLVVFRNFDETMLVDNNGRILERKPNGNDSEFITATASERGYEVVVERDSSVHHWVDIPLDPGMTSEFFRNGDMVFASVLVTSDGRLIARTVEGLSAYDTDGTRLWVQNEWSTTDGPIELSDFIYHMFEDNSGNIYIVLEDGIVVLKEDGSPLYAGYNDWFLPSVTADGTILANGSTYRVEDGALVKIASPDMDGSMGNYQVLADTGIAYSDPATGTTKWSYHLTQPETNRGFRLNGWTLIADSAGQAYITTSGGSVHALDESGNLRMKLIVDNAISSSAQVIPVSSSECVVIVNNGIYFFVSY